MHDGFDLGWDLCFLCTHFGPAFLQLISILPHPLLSCLCVSLSPPPSTYLPPIPTYLLTSHTRLLYLTILFSLRRRKEEGGRLRRGRLEERKEGGKTGGNRMETRHGRHDSGRLGEEKKEGGRRKRQKTGQTQAGRRENDRTHTCPSILFPSISS